MKNNTEYWMIPLTKNWSSYDKIWSKIWTTRRRTAEVAINKYEAIYHLNSEQELLCLSEDTKVPKEEISKLSSKPIENNLVTLILENPSTSDPIITTTK